MQNKSVQDDVTRTCEETQNDHRFVPLPLEKHLQVDFFIGGHLAIGNKTG